MPHEYANIWSIPSRISNLFILSSQGFLSPSRRPPPQQSVQGCQIELTANTTLLLLLLLSRFKCV